MRTKVDANDGGCGRVSRADRRAQSRIGQSLILSACLIAGAALTQPGAAAAQGALNDETLQAVAADPAARDPETRLWAGVAACLLNPNRPAQVVEALEGAGYESVRWGGLIELDYASTLVYVSDGLGFCDTQEWEVGSRRAGDLVRGLVARAGGDGWAFRRDARGCLEGEGPGPGGEPLALIVASAGQDPVCSESETSGVRVFWLR